MQYPSPQSFSGPGGVQNYRSQGQGEVEGEYRSAIKRDWNLQLILDDRYTYHIHVKFIFYYTRDFRRTLPPTEFYLKPRTGSVRPVRPPEASPEVLAPNVQFLF